MKPSEPKPKNRSGSKAHGGKAETALDGSEEKAEPTPAQPKRRKRRRPYWLVFLAFFIIFAVGFFFFLKFAEWQVAAEIGSPDSGLNPVIRVRTMLFLYRGMEELKAAHSGSNDSVVFTVQAGESAAQITARLSEAGLLADGVLFTNYLVYSGIDKKLIPGSYVLSQGMSPLEIGRRISDIHESLIRLILLPGQRLEEIAALIDASGFAFTGDEFLEAARNFPPENHPAGGTSLEGYFLSGSYQIRRTIPLTAFLNGFVNTFRQRVTPKLETAFAANGLTTGQAVILGSIIAREAMSAEEYPRIASVFYNRLRAGMKLESDPTAQYAIGWDAGSGSWWKMPLNGSDLAVVSEYNTYIVSGLPKGPICSPSLAVLEAVADPERTPYYYFRARCDGSPLHNFAVTYEEHVQNGCQ